ncbi:hypothetical protein GCM10008983_06520 [Lentibacillus halophilus]|uniref:Uncharacterized protein n=1 Tax=Lentibacillus halophilus TaxID=295065 RepID=A0ABP3IY04_9BACI
MENQNVFKLKQDQKSLNEKVDNIENMLMQNIEQTAIVNDECKQISKQIKEISNKLESVVGENHE